MSSIIYSGGTIVDTTFTTTVGTRQEIVTALQTQLTAAGWSVISGGGSGNVLMKSATTASPKSNSIRVRLQDPGAGNCATLKIENDAGTLTSQAFFLLPAAGKVYKIIACQYNFFVYTANPTAIREFACGGTLHIPDHLDGVVTGSLGWMHGNSSTDAGVSAGSFRTVLSSWTNAAYNSQIRNATLLNHNSAVGSAIAWQTLRVPSVGSAVQVSTGNIRWSDNAIVMTEALLGFGIAATTDEPKWQGFIHNGMVTSLEFPADDRTITSWDGHSWAGITVNNTGSVLLGRGTLFMAVT
jgi:hypothetical protein